MVAEVRAGSRPSAPTPSPNGTRSGRRSGCAARPARASSATATTTPRTCSGCRSARAPARVGLLDFQDALRAHPAWDLTHLLQDARRDVSPELEASCSSAISAARPGLDREAFLADYRALAASNAARILGRVFARQALLGRAQYKAFMPRTWRYLERNLTDPALAGLKAWFDRHVPAGARA